MMRGMLFGPGRDDPQPQVVEPVTLQVQHATHSGGGSAGA
jgi:hypothetical protein